MTSVNDVSTLVSMAFMVHSPLVLHIHIQIGMYSIPGKNHMYNVCVYVIHSVTAGEGK